MTDATPAPEPPFAELRQEVATMQASGERWAVAKTAEVAALIADYDRHNTLPETPEFEKATIAALGRAEWFAIVSRGALAFRFGPFTGPEIGKLMEQAVAEKIPMLITANCGAPFCWETARAMCPKAEEPTEPAAPAGSETAP